MSSNGNDKQSPVQVIRDDQDASIAASIWLRQTRAGVFYDVTVARAYKKSEDECGYSSTFGDRNLDAVLRVAERAKAWITGQKDNAVTVTGPKDDQQQELIAKEAA